MKTLDVGLDIDNVLYPWSEAFARWAEIRRGVERGSLSEPARSWSWYKDQLGMTTPEFLDLYESGVRAGFIFTKGAPLPGAVGACLKLNAAGHRLHYISSRSFEGITAPMAFDATARWLARWGFPVTSLTICDDKYDRYTDVFLDDAPHNVEALTAAGHPFPVLWNRLHNADVDVDAVRLDTWAEFLTLVDCLAALQGVDA